MKYCAQQRGSSVNAGFRQATLDDVARALSVTRTALYHYARSKDELLHEAGRIAQCELNMALEAASREPTGRQRLRAFFRHYAELVCDDFGRCFVLVDLTEMEPGEARRSRAFSPGSPRRWWDLFNRAITTGRVG